MKRCFFCSFILLLLSTQLAFSAPNPPAQLPRLDKSVSVDGNLTEWANVPPVAMHSKSYISLRKDWHIWQGPADASEDAYCGWNEKGLYIASSIKDNDVQSSPNPKALWQMDSVEFLIDARRGKDYMDRYPLEHGAYQLIVRPPSGKLSAFARFYQPEDAKVAGFKYAVKRTASGYNVELFFPWSAFPGVTAKAGTKLATQYVLNDHDSRDGREPQALSMTYQAQTELFHSPSKYIEWSLVDKLQTGKGKWLGPYTVVDAPTACIKDRSVDIAVEAPKMLSAQVASLSLTCTDASGKKLLNKTFTGTNSAKLKWTPAPNFQGYVTISVTANDKKGNPLGTASRQISYFGNTLAETISWLKQANISAMAQREPFRATAYLGVASCVEKFKRAAEEGDQAGVTQAAEEIKARRDVLQTGKVAAPTYMFDLLNLTANPESQVIVTYPYPDCSYVTLFWGSVPLATARVLNFKDASLAAKALEPSKDDIIKYTAVSTSIGGLRGKIDHQYLEYQGYDLTALDPTKQVLLIENTKGMKWNVCLDARDISIASVNAATILPGCDDSIRSAVEKWASDSGTPILGIKEAVKKEKILVAGNAIASKEITNRFRNRDTEMLNSTAGANIIKLAVGNRVINVVSPSEAVARKVAGIVAACKPVLPEDVDDIRMDLLRALDPADVKPKSESGYTLFCGDLHMHTFYSDGNCSPAGLMLMAMYGYKDFAVMTDHSTIRGALLADKLLKANGFSFPVTPGEEMSTDYWHMNAYPLKQAIPTTLSAQNTIAAAHAQGAIIHWNHPGWPPSPWNVATLSPEKFQKTGLDAWEHVPNHYDEKKANGTLPTLVGTTDTHDGTFDDIECTVILAASTRGTDIAGAVKEGNTVLVSPSAGKHFYGHDDMIAAVRNALAQGEAMKAAKASYISLMLRNADIVGLLKVSKPKVEK